jgi:hypothetical protein
MKHCLRADTRLFAVLVISLLLCVAGVWPLSAAPASYQEERPAAQHTPEAEAPGSSAGGAAIRGECAVGLVEVQHRQHPRQWHSHDSRLLGAEPSGLPGG